MRHVPIFLNELSYPLVAEGEAEIAQTVVGFVRTLSEIKKVVPDVVLGGSQRLSDIPINAGYETLASTLRGPHRDLWRSVRAIEQRSPCENVEGASHPQNVHWCDSSLVVGEGISWAAHNDTVVVSLKGERWTLPELETYRCSCQDGAHPAAIKASTRNVARPEHVAIHAKCLAEYALPFQGGSLVLSAAEFELRMPPRDHEPMHVHVCTVAGEFKHLATVRFDGEPEVLAGRLSAAMRKDVFDAIDGHRLELQQNWIRRRNGEDAFLVG